MIGVVKWFNDVKGYGFIRTDEVADVDIFVHYSSIVGEGYKTLREGDSVQYDLIQGPKGPAALNVVRAQQEASDEVEEGAIQTSAAALSA